MSTSPGPINHTTRLRTVAAPKKTRRELEDADNVNTTVKSKQQAIAYLTTSDYIPQGASVNPQTLAHVLLQLSVSNKIPKTMMDVIRAVAFLMEETYEQQLAKGIVDIVKEKLEEQLGNYASNVETMRDAVEHVTGAAKVITGKLEEFTDGFQASTDQLAQATYELTEKTTDTANKIPATTTPVQQHNTYASILQQRPDSEQAEIVARTETVDKQILIQKDKNATDNSLFDLSEKDLVAKANTALDLMGWKGSDKPHNTAFVAARKLRSGGILYNMNSQKAATWLHAPEVKKAFMDHFDGTSNIKDKLHYVIAEFVPVTYDAGASYAHANLEEANRFTDDAIGFSKFIKPPHLRSSNQKVAHVTIGFKSRDDANCAIQRGIYIEGKHVTVRKTLTEPRRCLKCQKFGHHAPDCKAEGDTCARCAAKHRTSLCTITDMTFFSCANCTGEVAKGHGAADRNCHRFKAEKEKALLRAPENKYKYFPTHDPNTWKLLNDVTPNRELTQQTSRYNTSRNPQQTEGRHQQHFMEDWQEVRRHRGRYPPPQNQASGTQIDNRTGVNTVATDNGWPVRPAQTTLDEYGYNTGRWQFPDKTTPEEAENIPAQRPVFWGDDDPYQPALGPPPMNAPGRRSLTPLEYA